MSHLFGGRNRVTELDSWADDGDDDYETSSFNLKSTRQGLKPRSARGYASDATRVRGGGTGTGRGRVPAPKTHSTDSVTAPKKRAPPKTPDPKLTKSQPPKPHEPRLGRGDPPEWYSWESSEKTGKSGWVKLKDEKKIERLNEKYLKITPMNRTPEAVFGTAKSSDFDSDDNDVDDHNFQETPQEQDVGVHWSESKATDSKGKLRANPFASRRPAQHVSQTSNPLTRWEKFFSTFNDTRRDLDADNASLTKQTDPPVTSRRNDAMDAKKTTASTSTAASEPPDLRQQLLKTQRSQVDKFEEQFALERKGLVCQQKLVLQNHRLGQLQRHQTLLSGKPSSSSADDGALTKWKTKYDEFVKSQQADEDQLMQQFQLKRLEMQCRQELILQQLNMSHLQQQENYRTQGGTSTHPALNPSSTSTTKAVALSSPIVQNLGSVNQLSYIQQLSGPSVVHSNRVLMDEDL